MADWSKLLANAAVKPGEEPDDESMLAQGIDAGNGLLPPVQPNVQPAALATVTPVPQHKPNLLQSILAMNTPRQPVKIPEINPPTQLDQEELRAARSRDFEAQRQADISNALGSVAFRTQMHQQNIGSPAEEQLMKSYALKRQQAQDLENAELKRAQLEEGANKSPYHTGNPILDAMNALKLQKLTEELDPESEANLNKNAALQQQRDMAVKELGFTPEEVSKLDARGLALAMQNRRLSKGLEQRNVENSIKNQRLALAQSKFGRQVAQTELPGYEFSVPLNAKQHDDMVSQLTAKKLIDQNSEEANRLWNSMGPLDLAPGSTKMQTLMAKFTAMKPLIMQAGRYGNLTVGHQHLLDTAVGGDPDKFSNILRNTLQSERLPSILNNIQHEAQMAVDSQLETLGGHKIGAGWKSKADETSGKSTPKQEQPKPQQQLTPSAPGMVKVKRISDGKIVEMPKEAADRFLAKSDQFEKVNG